MTRRLNIVLLALAIIVGLPVWYLFVDTSPWTVSRKDIDLVAARKLATTLKGQRPQSLEVSVVGWRRVPGNVFAAGSGFKRKLIAVQAFRLVVPGQRPIMIESGIAKAYADELGLERFDARAQANVDQALREAGTVLVTHEHGDHLGGLASLTRQIGGADLAAKAKLNRYQVPSGKPTIANAWAAGLQIQPTVSTTQMQAIAPGVVTVPAPGHTPGSQMIFVLLADGTEILFAGDTAPLAVSWKEQRPAGRINSDFWTPQDRAGVIGWLQALNALKRANPGLVIIPGHDFEWLDDRANHVPIGRMPDLLSNNRAGNPAADRLEAQRF